MQIQQNLSGFLQKLNIFYTFALVFTYSDNPETKGKFYAYFSVRLAAALLLSLSLAACQASGTAGSSRGANASIFTNILTLQF